MTDDQTLLAEVRAKREARAGGRKELIRRVAALSPEAIVEGLFGAYLDAEGFIIDAEGHEHHLRFARLNREVQKRIEKGKTLDGRAYERNSERIAELFDEMELLDPDPERERAPLSKKYQRQAALNARIAERKS